MSDQATGEDQSATAGEAEPTVEAEGYESHNNSPDEARALREAGSPDDVDSSLVDEIERERQERLDPDNRPENAEIDNTGRTFNTETGGFEDDPEHAALAGEEGEFVDEEALSNKNSSDDGEGARGMDDDRTHDDEPVGSQSAEDRSESTATDETTASAAQGPSSDGDEGASRDAANGATAWGAEGESRPAEAAQAPGRHKA